MPEQSLQGLGEVPWGNALELELREKFLDFSPASNRVAPDWSVT
jgi:hypothetical protein